MTKEDKPNRLRKEFRILSNRKPSHYWALASLAFSMLLTSMAVSIPNVALPVIAREFGSSVAEAQRVVGAYLLAITFTIVAAGRMGDTMGRRRVLLVGILLYISSAFACAFAPTLWLLVGARILQGLGAAVVMSLTLASSAEVNSTQKMGSSISLLGTMSAVGTAAGPSMGGIIIGVSSWRSTFMMMAFLGLLSFFLVYRFLPDSHQTGVRPKLRLSILCEGGLGINLAMNAIISTVMMSTLIVGPFYLSSTLGLESIPIGLIMSVGPLVSILSGIPAGKAVNRWGPEKITSVGLSVIGLGAMAFVTLPAVFGLVGYILASAILSPGYQLFQSANGTSALTHADGDQRGMVSGLLSFSRNLGLMAGACLMGSIYAHSSMEITFLVGVFLTVIALGISRKGKYEKRLP